MVEGRYNSLENPIGIETIDQETGYPIPERYNSLENPIGIETIMCFIDSDGKIGGYNSLENPIGIET